MFKRKIGNVKTGISQVKSRKRAEKRENIEEKLNKSKSTGRMDEFSEDYEPGRYVRLLNKPSASKESEKKLRKRTKVKKLIENEDRETRILKQLNFDKSSVLSGINALFKVLEQKRENDAQLLDVDTPIFLQLTSIKIPICPSRTLRLPLKHSLHNNDSTVCFIVSDVKGIIKKEHEKVSEYYEKFFEEKGIETKINKILSLHELKTEYGEFEMKRKLLSTYDVFFVDGRISSYVSRHLGKIFRSKRRLPIPIDFERGMSTKIKYAMSRTSMNLHGHGSSYSVQIGHCNMSTEQIYENILSVCARLMKDFPGGWENVKVVNLKTDLSMAIPLYLSLKNPSEVKVPKTKIRRAKASKSFTDEISTLINSKVTVYPSGNVFVQKMSPSKKRKLQN